MTAGHKLLSPDAIEQDVLSGFSSDFQTKNPDDTANGNVGPYSLTLDGTPIRPFKVTVRIPALDLQAQDYEGDGKLIGYGITGTVDYTTGAISITLAADPLATHPIYVDYFADFESFTSIPKMIMKLRSKIINARVWALEDTIGMEQAFILKKRFDMIAEDGESCPLAV